MNVIVYLLLAVIQLNAHIERTTSSDPVRENSPIAIEKRNQPPSTGTCLNSSSGSGCKEWSVDLDDSQQLGVRLNEVDIISRGLARKSAMIAKSSVYDSRNSSLRQVLFIHRHGDRTPIAFPSKDPLKKEPFWIFHGYGQLTNRGKARLFLLGKIIRARYNDFLGKSVNKNQLISRSSGALRCIESAQVFLSAFLELNQPGSGDASKLNWDPKTRNPLSQLWQPASIQSVPVKFDGMLAESAECKKLSDEYANVIDPSTEIEKLNSEYKHEADVLNSVLGYEMDHFYKWFWAGGQVEVERSYFPDKVHPELLSVYDRVQDAANLAIDAYQMTLNSKRLRSGLLINDMVRNMMKVRDQAQTSQPASDLKKFVHYAAHDLTLAVLLGMFDSWHKFPFRPEYAANIALELHQDEVKNEWYVRILYMPEVPSKPVELHLENCERDHPNGRCLLDRFSELMKPFMVDNWQSWMKECGNDHLNLDPYAPGH